MLYEPNCFTRGCVHYEGVSQPDGTEKTERHVCAAFPKGIPDEIAHGPNKHLTPLAVQKNDLVFTPNPTPTDAS